MAPMIPMRTPDGRTWHASSEVEVMELLARGYSRSAAAASADTAPPADLADQAPEPSGRTEAPAN